MTWLRRRSRSVIRIAESLAWAFVDPDVLFYIMLVMTVVAWTLVILLIAGVI